MANNNQNSEGKRTVRLSDVIKITLHHWPWIVLSVVVCVSLATFYVLRSQPTYKRFSQIVIKDDSGGSSLGSQLSAFAGMGMLGSSTNIRDEINKLQSPDLMETVVRRLNLDMNYSLPGKFHDKIVYGDSLPVVVTLSDFTDADAASFKLEVAKNGDITLSDVVRSTERNPEPVMFDFVQKAPIKFGIPAKTPLGQLLVTTGPAYVPGQEYTVMVDRQPIIAAANDYSGKIDIQLQDQWANTIEFTAVDNDLQRADDLLTNMVKVYNENWIQNQNETSKSTNKFISERLVAIERDLSGVDSDIADYQSTNLVPDLVLTTTRYMQTDQKAEELVLNLNNRLQVTKFLKQYLDNPANRNTVLPANVGIESPAIEKQIAEYNKQLLERDRLVTNSSEHHPLLVSMDSQLDNMYSAIKTSVNNEISSLTEQLRNVRGVKGEATSKIANSPVQAKHLLSVERQRKVMESLYTFLLQKREENELTQVFTPSNTEVIAKPFGDLMPVSPKKKLIVAFAFLFGFCLPFGVTFVKEVTNTKVRSKKEIEELSIPLIGEIPWWRDRKGDKERKAAGMDERIVVEPSNRNIINDAFRVLRTNVNFLTKNDGVIDGQRKRGSVIMMTSIDANNGKSFVSANLAVSLALREKKVIVIDGDLRHGSTSELIGSPAKGISDFLSGGVSDWRPLVVTDGSMQGADVLPVGHFPPNPTELLEVDRFSEMVTEMSREYDYVIIDCPPVNAMADARIIEKISDRCIFVVRIGHLERENLPELEKLYKNKEYKNMSVILNGIQQYGRKKIYGYSDGYHSNSGK
jgi:tyrosine-protein kinase Etk/Wzc